MMKQSFIHLGSAFLVLTLALGASFGMRHLMKKEAAASALLAEEITKKTQEADRFANARATLSSLAADEAAIQAHFVDTKDIVGFLETIQNTGKALGATSEVVSVAGGKAVRDTLVLSLQISGPFDSVLRTLGALEHNTYATTLTSLTLEETPGEGALPWTAKAVFSIASKGVATSTPTKTP